MQDELTKAIKSFKFVVWVFVALIALSCAFWGYIILMIIPNLVAEAVYPALTQALDDKFPEVTPISN